MNNIHVKTGDTVVVLSGQVKGKQGQVLVGSPKCGKPTRLAHKINADGTKQRACKKCGETF